MTKEELKKEAEDNKPPYAFCALNTNCELWKDGYEKGAEPREKRIAELEGICKDLSYKFDYQVKQVMKLEKENAELKKKLKPENCLKLLAKEGYIKFTSEQLTKAKELLERCYDNYIYLQPLRGDIEQFLKEI